MRMDSLPTHNTRIIVNGSVCACGWCNAQECFKDYRVTPQTMTGLFKMFCPYSHAFTETSQKATHLNTTPSQARFHGNFMPTYSNSAMRNLEPRSSWNQRDKRGK